MSATDTPAVADSKSTELRFTHPAVYGSLLEINSAMESVGGFSLVCCLASLLGTYSALWLEWYRFIPGLERTDLSSIWIYALVFVLFVGIWGGIVGWQERRQYQRHRTTLYRLLAQSGISRHEAISAIEGDRLVAKASQALKLDRESITSSDR